LQKIAEGNIDQDTFNKSIEALIKDQETSIQNNIYIAQSYANSAVIYRSPLSRLDNRPALYRAVTPADIQQVQTELLAGSPVKMVLYPEEAANP